MKKLMKLPLKLLALPLIFLCAAGHWLMFIVNRLSAYICGTPLLFILGCGIYSLVQQEWKNFWILTALEIGFLFILFAAVWLETVLDDTASRLTEFLYS